jgi:hypothetical protein
MILHFARHAAHAAQSWKNVARSAARANARSALTLHLDAAHHFFFLALILSGCRKR